MTALAEPDPARLARAQQVAPGIPAHPDFGTLLEDASIGAVVISAPYEAHAAITLAALGAGKHVYLEKPFTTTLQDAAEVRNAWQASQRVGAIGFNYRFHPYVVAMRDAVRAGAVGAPLNLQTAFSFAPHGGVDWDITRHGAFGALFDLGPHEIDLARYLTGTEVRRVSGRARSIRAANDTVVLEMEMDDATSVQSFLSTQCIAQHRVTISGTEGKLTADLYRTPGLWLQDRKPGTAWRQVVSVASQLPLVAEKLRSPWREPSFLRAINAFIVAARTGGPVSPSFEDGYRSQQVVEAAQDSLASGRVVEVSAA